MSFTLPLPPNPDDMQYKENPLAYNRAIFRWAVESKGKLEQLPSISNGIPIAGPQIGDMPYKAQNAWARLAGSSASAGQIMKYGTSSAPVWGNISSNIAAGTGISVTGTSTATINNNIAAGTNITITGTSVLTIAGLNHAPITNSLGTDITLNGTSSYFAGPSVAQGTAGSWFAAGSVNLFDTVGAAAFNVRLWDGSNVMSSVQINSPAASTPVVAALSGYIASPVGNIRISVNDQTSTNGKILFNQSGNSKDSTLTAIRIA